MNPAVIEKRARDNGRYILPDMVQVIAEYQAAKTYHQRNLDNSLENWRFYYAKNPELGFGQYRLDVAQKLLAQNRALVQYNFCKPTVDALAGSLLQMKFDPSFVPVNADVTSLTEAIQKAMYSDKEMMNWNTTFLDLVTGGLIHEGWYKIVVSDKYSKLGNIGIETCLPGSVISDPHWKTPLTSDCRRIFHEVWLTAEEMLEKYPKERYRIQFYATKDRKLGLQYGTNRGVTAYDGAEVVSGSKYKIVEEYRVIEKKTKCSYIIRPEGDMLIPKEIPEADIPQWLDATYPDWSPEYIYENDKVEKECRVRPFCEALVSESFLDDGKSEVQIDATPFKSWSASRFNGEPHSIIDSVKDAQTNINYLESMLLHKIQTEGTGGAQFADRTMFASQDEYLRYVQNRNNPRAIFEMKPGLMERGQRPAMPVLKDTQFPNEAYAFLDRIMNQVWPHISKVTPSFLGRAETTNMSGVLFNSMKQQTDLTAWTLHYGLRNHMNDFYEGYLIQAAKTYSNELVPRQFLVNGGCEKIVLNERITLEDGSEAIRNDASQLLEIRHKVIISEKPESPSEQMSNVSLYSELISSLGGSPVAAPQVAFMTNQVIQNLPQISQEDKEMLADLGQKSIELAVANVEMQTSQARMAKMQADMQMAQAQMQAQQMNSMAPAQPMPQNTAMPQASQSQPQPLPPQMAGQTAPQVQGVLNG